MKVILLKQRRNLGKPGEIVNVKDGFGRNFLLPQKIAMRATPENIKDLEKKKSELDKQNKEALKAAEALAKKVEDKHFTFIKQCGDDGRLFGSVNAKEIAQHVSEELKSEICHSAILLSHPIKSLGVYEVIISVHPDVDCQILVNAARSESEAAEALKEYKTGGRKEEKPEEEAAPAAKEEKASAKAEEAIAEEETPAAEEKPTEEESE